VTVRALQNSFTKRWVGHEEALLAQREAALAQFEVANQQDDINERGLLAGMGASQINDIRPAGEIIREIVADAKRLLG
jgi:nitronate monooxygenase